MASYDLKHKSFVLTSFEELANVNKVLRKEFYEYSQQEDGIISVGVG